jgi:dolichol kinase
MNRAQREPGLLWPALWRLALAGAAFVIVYSGCNHFTAARGDVPTLMFEWERHIPFVRELVVPYWSLDLFFCGAFFMCRSRHELNLLTKRLIAVTIASGVCYLLFPLKLALPRPEPVGWTAPLFHVLYFNDLPYNLAPSLHISLRSLVWVFYGAHLTGWLRTSVKVWFILIGLSTLLVWQHHLVDVAGGFVMGWAIAALIPDPRQLGTRNPSRHYALRYGAGATVCVALSFVSIFFVWPAVACGIMALAYVTGLSRLLGKENGTLSPCRRVVPAARAHRHCTDPEASGSSDGPDGTKSLLVSSSAAKSPRREAAESHSRRRSRGDRSHRRIKRTRGLP